MLRTAIAGFGDADGLTLGEREGDLDGDLLGDLDGLLLERLGFSFGVISLPGKPDK